MGCSVAPIILGEVFLFWLSPLTQRGLHFWDPRRVGLCFKMGSVPCSPENGNVAMSACACASG